MELIYSYEKEDKNLTYEKFWQNLSGDFDNKNKTHVIFMLKSLLSELSLDDYALKRVETTIKTELPVIAQKRHLAKKWLIQNINY